MWVAILGATRTTHTDWISGLEPTPASRVCQERVRFVEMQWRIS